MRTRRDSPIELLPLEVRLTSAAWEDLCRRAADPDTAPEELAELAAHHAWVVRAAVAAHPRAPHDTVERLRSDRAWGVRAAVERRDPERRDPDQHHPVR